MRHLAVILLMSVVLLGCSESPSEPARYHPGAPVIEDVSASLEGEGWRFEVGVDGDCLDYRIHTGGFADSGGTVCHQGSQRQLEVEHPQVHPNQRSSSADLLAVAYDGCVRAPSINGIRAWDTQTTTTVCDSRVPPLVFGHLAGDIAYACMVSGPIEYPVGGQHHYPTTNEDGVFLFRVGPETPEPGFVLGFTEFGHFRDFEPVDAAFAPALEACEELAPWAGQPGWGQP